MSVKLVTIARYRDVPLAGLAKSKLESAGIPCFLDNEFTIGANWLYSNALGGVQIKVNEADAEEAKRILDDTEVSTAQEEPEELRCPMCGGTEVELVDYKRKSAALSLLLGLPLVFFRKRYRCLQCGHNWK